MRGGRLFTEKATDPTQNDSRFVTESHQQVTDLVSVDVESDRLSVAVEPSDVSSWRSFSWSRISQFASSITDQVFTVGGMFLGNIALARTRSKEEYGMFALSYSIFLFISGLYNAAILEPYTIHGSGRYRNHFPDYRQLMWQQNAVICGSLGLLLLITWGVLRMLAPSVASGSFLGLALSVSVLLSALFVRRTLYLLRLPGLAAKFSIISFVTLCGLLLLATRLHVLSGFALYLIAAAALLVGGFCVRQHLPSIASHGEFHILHPGHWWEHWKYARWVLVTAFVYQFTNQAYYWLLASFLSVKEVADLRVLHLLVGPVDQIFVASSLLILPVMAFRYAARMNAELVSLWKVFGLLNVVLTLVYATLIRVLAAPLMHTIYSGRFDDLAALLSILALLPVMMALGNSANVALKSIERPDLVLWAYVASGLTTFVIGIPLVRHGGLRGAIYGMLVSAGIYSASMIVMLWSTTHGDVEQRVFTRTARNYANGRDPR